MNNTTSMSTVLPLPVYQVCLLAAYSIILFGGGVANSLLLWMVNETAGLRNKNPLLIGLFVCDIVVCVMTAPIAIILIAVEQDWTSAYELWCKLSYYFEEIPVFASTMNMMFLSLDRWLNVKFPQPAGKYYIRRRIIIFSTVACWLVSILANLPIAFTRRLDEIDVGLRCVERWESRVSKLVFISIQMVFGYIIPCSVIMFCHLGIKASLTRVSLSTRVAHGELPLPFPFMRIIDNMPILIIGLRTKVKSPEEGQDEKEEDGNEEQQQQVQEEQDIEQMDPDGHNGDAESTQIRLVETTFSTKKRNRMVVKMKHKRCGTLERRRRQRREEQMRTSRKKRHSKIDSLNETIKIRRRTAKQLVTYGTIICCCWFPYVCCVIYQAITDSQSDILNILTQCSLLFGHSHSAVNPLFYYLMNRSTLSRVEFPCSKCFQGVARRSTARNNASSTNEAALGPFNPRLVRPPSQREQRRPVRRRSSLEDLYLI